MVASREEDKMLSYVVVHLVGSSVVASTCYVWPFVLYVLHSFIVHKLNYIWIQIL